MKIKQTVFFLLFCIFASFASIRALPPLEPQTAVQANKSLISINLTSPKYGASPVTRFEFNISTGNHSDCKYSYNPSLNFSEITSPSNVFSTNDGYSHTISDFNLDISDGEQKTLYVLCMADTEYVNNGFPKKITLMVDKTQPNIISAMADPDFVIERLQVDLVAETDDLSICRFDMENTNPETYYSFFDNANISNFTTKNIVTLTSSTEPKIEDNKNYTFFVTCMNNAGMFSETIAYFNFAVNLSVPNSITAVSPEGVITVSNAEIEVITNRASTCRYGTNFINYFPQKNTKTHFIQVDNLAEGEHSYKVRCDFDQGSPAIIEKTILFSVIKTTPGSVNITTAAETCNNKSLNATFSTNTSFGFVGYVYKITDSKNNILVNNTFTNSSFVLLANLNLTLNEKYYWEAWAQDVAGKNGTLKKTAGTVILSADTCKETVNISLSSELTETGISAAFTCFDKNSQCKNITYLIIDSKNPTCACGRCTYTLYNNSGLIIKENSTICYEGVSSKNVSITGYKQLKYIDCGSTEAGCCGGKKALICESDCVKIGIKCNLEKLDTDGDGIPDVKEKECKLDYNNASDANIDSDKDGLSNIDECLKYQTDPFSKDTDGDKVDDKSEIDKGSDPKDKNSYPADADTDGDGISNKKEIECGLDLEKDDADLDNDNDGLSNKAECITYKTKIDNADSDGDKVSDKIEIDKGTDPNDPSSFPKSHVLSVLLFILGFAVTAGGIYFFLKDKPKETPKSQSYREMTSQPAKPFVNFNETRKEIHQEIKQQEQEQKQIMPSKDDLDYQLKRKKEQLRLRSMGSIFDEFAKDNSETKGKEDTGYEEIANIQQVNKEKNVFDRLDSLNKKNINEDNEPDSRKIKKNKML